MATPNAMPKKVSPIHQQILAGLLATKPASWVHKTDVTPAERQPTIVERTITRQALRFPLAQNVSDLSIERAARVWL
jgi:hypothetical protein